MKFEEFWNKVKDNQELKIKWLEMGLTFDYIDLKDLCDDLKAFKVVCERIYDQIFPQTQSDSLRPIDIAPLIERMNYYYDPYEERRKTTLKYNPYKNKHKKPNWQRR